MNKFYNKNGSLSIYALSCGYVELTEIDGYSVELWKEHNCYHVRKHNHNNGQRVVWDSFYSDEAGSIAKARALFLQLGGKFC